MNIHEHLNIHEYQILIKIIIPRLNISRQILSEFQESAACNTIFLSKARRICPEVLV